MPSIAPSKSTISTCVARVPYLNSAPFFRGLSLPQRYGFSEYAPRQLAQQAAVGQMLAGLLPSVELFRQEDAFERLGHFGIAVRGRSRSTLLFSTRPLRQLDGAVIAITEETSTTVCLLRLLLEERYHITPADYQRGQTAKADALLLIGDEALRFQHANTRYPFEIDVSFEWWLWQHLPFVFAVWAIRKDADAQDKKQIELGLARALSANLAQLDALAQERANAFGIPAEVLNTYLSNFVYRLGQDEEQGLKRFRELAHAHRLL